MRSIDPLRVLVVSARVGGGHDAMANALRREIGRRHPGVDVDVVDGLDLQHPLLGTAARDGYRALVNHGGGRGWGAFWDATRGARGLELLNRASERLLAAPLERAISQRKPDAVVSTFPAVTAALGRLRSEGRIDQPVVAALIDADPHPMWFADGVDEHLAIVPNDVGRIAQSRPLGPGTQPPVRLVQPPIDRSLGTAAAATTSDVRQALGPPGDGPLLLVSGGSMGLRIDEAFVRGLLDADDRVSVGVLTGRDPHLAAVVDGVDGERAQAIPFTDRMPELLRAADAVMTNSAGMTTLEAFGAQTPVIMHNVVPGHGMDGARALAGDGYVTLVDGERSLADVLGQVGRADGDVAATATNASGVFDEHIPHMSDVVVGHAASARANVRTS